MSEWEVRSFRKNLKEPRGNWILMESMKIAESVLNALAEPVLLLDGSLCAVMANPAFHDALGIVPGQLEGKPIQQLIAEQSSQPHLKMILDAPVFEANSVVEVEIVCTTPPQTRKVFSVIARRVAVDPACTDMVIVELHDITRAKETEQRIQDLNERLQQHGADLEKANKELEAFTHSVSHDLRTPLRLTSKIAHMLLQDFGAQLPSGAQERVHLILDSVQEMGKLIEDLLSFSQVNREPMKRKRVDARRLANEALTELRDERQDRDVEVVIDELPPVLADRALLKQVFLNLLANALKFTRPCKRAEIRVSFTQCKGQTVYLVRDNGVGFDMSHAESMFLVFHRLHRSHDFEGSGIGLALAKRIIERHSGRIWAEGETGSGATIYFTLGE